MDKNIFTSKCHILSRATRSTLELIHSPHSQGITWGHWTSAYNSLPLGQCCLHLQRDSHMATLCSLLLQGPSSQSRPCSLSPGSSSRPITKRLHAWWWDSQQPEASVNQAAEGNAKWRSVSGIPHFSTLQSFFKLTDDNRNYSWTLSVFRGLTCPFRCGWLDQDHSLVLHIQC